MNSNQDHAALLLDRAEECRAIAATLDDGDLKSEFLGLAEAYLALASREEKLSKRGRVENHTHPGGTE